MSNCRGRERRNADLLDVGSSRRHALSVLSIGDTAPDFDGVDQSGQHVTLDGLVKESAVVLYFYPKDFTPVCTAQACLFRDTEAELAAEGVRVVGVSGDDTASHVKFAAAHKVPYPLLSDPDKRIQKAYEARQLLGLLTKRVTYVIDKQKKIRGVFHHELSAQKHVDAVRKVIASLKS
jgi:thioredoxin-dependent peroxiredoxin